MSEKESTAERDARRAKALRDNLKRRKAASRRAKARESDPPPAKPT